MRVAKARRILHVEALESRYAPAVVAVNAAASVHAIDPNIYGTAFATTAQLNDLKTPINRNGGNASDTYSFPQDATNHGSDWFFESIAEGTGNGQGIDSWINATKSGSAQPSITLNLFDWAAKLGSGRSILGSFPVAKYGSQQSTDPYHSEWGNGVRTNGTNITGNDPNDAYIPNSPTIEQAWIQHLISTFGNSQNGGVKYYNLGNEPGLWNSTHRDMHPGGDTLPELRDRIISYASMVKALDPNAKILGPEEWGWTNYFISGADAAAANWGATYNGLNAQAWLLDQLRQHDTASGQRLLDYFTLHFYPQGGQFSDDVSTSMELLRNRSTRSLWDPNYVDESWIASTGINGGKVNLINLMKNWVNTYYPGTKLGITEYNWGAEGNMNGATTQADIWGIFGREGLDLANRWTTPDTGTPTYLAMKLYRNYDGAGSAFGGTSVSASVANPDQTSAFASLRASDGVMTVMVVNKNLYDLANPSATTSITINLSNFAAGGTSQRWQLAAVNPSNQSQAAISHLSDVAITGSSFTVSVPMESVSLFVIAPAQGSNQPPTLAALSQAAINEDGPTQTVALAGITDGGEGGQPLTVTATSSNTAIISNPVVGYTANSSTGTLTFRPTANASGSVTITVIVNDGQASNNTVTRTFTVIVNPINDAPTLNAINPLTLTEDAGPQTVALSGISIGPANESPQPLTVTVTSSNPALIPDPPVVSYASPSSTGSISFTPVANAFGSALITVVVNDGQGSSNTTTRTFTISVSPTNDLPTLNSPNPIQLNEDAGSQTVALSGIGAGPPNENGQPLTVSATSSNPALIPSPPVISYSSPNSSGALTFTPVPNAYGTATITVTVNDGQSTNNTVSRTFTVSVSPINDLPTLDIPNAVFLNEDSPRQTVTLTGITAGPGNEGGQPLTVSASSNNPALISDPPVILYTSPNGTGALVFTPLPDAFGSATISVIVNDGQGASNLVTRTVTVSVSPANDLPALDALNPVTLNEDSPIQTVSLTGISSGPANESSQPLTVAAFSSDTTLVPTPLISYTGTASTGTLTFKPAADAFGTATISVVVNDGQSSNNTVTRTFAVTVNPINDAPTLNNLPDLTLAMNAGQQTRNLNGIAAGPPNEAQLLTITAASNNASLIPNPSVTYASPNSTGTLIFTPTRDASGTALITVTVNDGAGLNNAVIQTFKVTVL